MFIQSGTEQNNLWIDPSLGLTSSPTAFPFGVGQFPLMNNAVAQQLELKLQQLVTDSELMDKMDQAFGNNWDIQKAQSLTQDWLTGEFQGLPEIKIVSQADINGANGAFADATDTIYLSREFLAQNTTNPEAVVDLLLEETGHFIDSVVNSTDTPGDEGERFAAVVQGKTLTPAELAAIQAEDDTATVVIDGQTLVIEQDNTRSAAFNVGTLNGTRSFSNWVGRTDTNDYYRFYVGSTSNFSLTLNGLSADADVELLNSTGGLITSSTYDGSTAESISRRLNPGTYYVRVYPYSSGNTNYNLSLSVPTTTINMGVNQTLSGSLSTTDPSNSTRTGRYKDDYRLTGITAGQPVKVNLNSSAFDAYVQIINQSTGAVVAYNDDATNSTNNSELRFTPQSGVNYLVRVTSYGSGNTGAYSLSTTSTPPTNVTITASDSSAAETLSGQTANPGQFTITRTGSTSNALRVNYTVGGTATKGSDYSNLTGSLTIPAGSTRATLPVNVIDDSTVEGSETAVVSLSSGSAYTLGSTSSATVTITDNDVAAINMGVNQTLSGSLSTTDPSNSTRTGSYKDDYRLTGVTGGQPVKVNLNSSAFDAYLQIINQSTGAVVADNDDATNGTNNSELTFTPQSGVNYLVRVTSYGSGSTGAYTLSTSSGSSDWFAQNIQDPGLQSIARSRASDNVLDRNDMIAILGDAKDGSVIDANELTSLRTLVNNASRFNMPDSVRVLSNKIVNSDPANQSYQGSYLGNLFAGSSGTQMDNLINKWFLGLDRPSTPSTYQYATGSLFVNGATYQDIDQGAANDCYYLASLATTAFRSPSTIQNMFIDNGDNTYTVRFYNSGVTDYVTVDRYLPTSSGSPAYAKTPNGELWVALAEKAYAQVNQSGWIEQDGTNSYSGIDYGWGSYAIPHITGRITSYVYDPSGIVNTNAIINAFNTGSMIVVDSKPSGVASDVVPNHEYTLVGYNSSTQQFTLYNPWGVNGGYDDHGTFKPGQLQLTASQLSQSFHAWAYTTNNGLPQYGSSTTLPPEVSGQKI